MCKQTYVGAAARKKSLRDVDDNSEDNQRKSSFLHGVLTCTHTDAHQIPLCMCSSLMGKRIRLMAYTWSTKTCSPAPQPTNPRHFSWPALWKKRLYSFLSFPAVIVQGVVSGHGCSGNIYQSDDSIWIHHLNE